MTERMIDELIFFHTPTHPNLIEARTLICSRYIPMPMTFKGISLGFTHLCEGILDYDYATWWKCRRCQGRVEITP